MTRPRLADKKHEFAPPGGQVKVTTAADLGKAIRDKRMAEGLTLHDVAPMCDVGVRFLSEVERGKPGAELGKVLKVAEVLGLDLLAVPRSTEEGV